VKPTRRRRRPQARGNQKLQAEIFVDEDVFYAPGVFSLPGSQSAHGGLRARWGQIQFAMRAIITICDGLPPKNFNASKLTQDVRAHLAKDPEYRALGFREISRPTILRAAKTLWEANPAHRK
jgi:hypothetical protein